MNLFNRGCMYCEGECTKECIEPYNKSTNEQWDEIYEDYLKDEYPVFGGPFTNALTFIEWLKINYDVPQIKQNGKQ